VNVGVDDGKRKIHRPGVSLIRVFGRAQGIVYEHENFGGASRTFAGDMSNLENLNNKITSIEVR